MIKLNNSNATLIQLQYQLHALCTNFNKLDWQPFTKLYDDPENTTITASIGSVKAKITEIDTYIMGDSPIDINTLNQLIKNLNETVQNLPPALRGHIENALKEEARKQDLDLLTIDTPKQNTTPHAPDQPLVIHMAGTWVDDKRLDDPLAYWVRQQPNFFIQGGVTDLVFGTGGAQNVETVLTHIRSIHQPGPEKTPPTNKRIVLTGYSRGAASQMTLANRIHEEFNKNPDGTYKDEKDWVKIDMLLVDPAFGVIDSKEAATNTHNIPPCVNTLNIIYAEPDIEPFSRHAQNTLISEPKHTIIQTINVRGTHVSVGLFDRILGKRLSSYFVEAMCRLFLGRAGRDATPTNEPKLNKQYVKDKIIAPTQTAAMQYYSSYAARSDAKDLDIRDANALQFSATIPQYLIGANNNPEEKLYHNLLMKMYGAIIKGDYETRFLSGKKHQDRTQSRLPEHMYQMCTRIETYCVNLKEGNNPGAKEAFVAVQEFAHNAMKSSSVNRTDNVHAFYSNISRARTEDTDKTASQIEQATSHIAPKAHR